MGEVSLSSFASLSDVGIAGVALAVIFFGFQAFKMVVEQWKSSTDAMERNTKSFESLSMVFEKQGIREMEFQKEVLTILKDGQTYIEDTHTKVTDLHRKVFINDKGA